MPSSGAHACRVPALPPLRPVALPRTSARSLPGRLRGPSRCPWFRWVVNATSSGAQRSQDRYADRLLADIYVVVAERLTLLREWMSRSSQRRMSHIWRKSSIRLSSGSSGSIELAGRLAGRRGRGLVDLERRRIEHDAVVVARARHRDKLVDDILAHTLEISLERRADTTSTA